MQTQSKLKINFIIGHKSQIYIPDATATGERRIYDTDFWHILEQKVEPNFLHLYKPFDLKIPFTQSFTNIYYHINNANLVRKKINKNEISHIFFEEESALLRLTNLPNAIATCLDIIPIAHPEDIKWHYKRFYTECVKGLKKARKIITISEHTKKDLVKFLNIDPQKIVTAYWGINKIFRQKNVKHDFYQKFNLDPKSRYILSVGGLHIKRKNMDILIEILPALLKKHPDLKLIISGYNKANAGLPFMQMIKEKNLEDKVILLSNLTDEDLCSIYNLASLLVFPSLYEGFGLPPVEAMACGTPVIAGNNSSLPEAVGDGGVLLNPRSQQELVYNIDRVLTDKKLNEHLINKGFAHIKKFTWQNYADKLYQVYKELDESQRHI